MVIQERAERTRGKLIDAAAAAFESEGFASAGLSRIAQQARVTKGALYFHFASKRELAEAVRDQAEQTLLDLVDKAHARRDGRLPLQTLIDLTHDVVQGLAADPKLRARLRLMDDLGLQRETTAAARLEWSELTRALLGEPGSDAGSNGAPHALPGTQTWALSCILTGLELLFRRNPELTGTETLSSIWQLVLPGLVGPEHVDRYRPEGTNAPTESPG